MGTTHLCVTMPDDISQDPIQSAIWANLVPKENCFTADDIPNLRLLCYWHAVARQAEDVIHKADGQINIFDTIGFKPYKTPDGKSVPFVRKNPALAILKEASAEIRALSDMLGLSPTSRAKCGAQPVQKSNNARILSLVMTDRANKESKAVGA